MEQRVLVIGGSGLLGRALCRAVPAGVSVDAPTQEDLPLEDVDRIEKRWREHDTTHVLLVAAWTRVDDCESDPERAFLTNGLLPGRVARRAALHDIPVTFLSTDYVFPGTSTTPYREFDPVGPTGVYGRSKWSGECEVRSSGGRHRIIRTSGLYGEGGPDFVSAVLPRLRNDEIRVVHDQTLAPTSVLALAPAVWQVALGPEPGTFHLTCGGEVSWFEFARRIATRIGVSEDHVRPVSTAEFGRPAPRPAYSVLDNQRARVLLGVEMPHWDLALSDHLSRVGEMGP